MTRAEVAEKIARMKAVQRGLVKAVGSDYNDQRRPKPAYEDQHQPQVPAQ